MKNKMRGKLDEPDKDIEKIWLEESKKRMNNPAASSGVSKTEYVFLNAASGGEFTLSD